MFLAQNLEIYLEYSGVDVSQLALNQNLEDTYQILIKGQNDTSTLIQEVINQVDRDEEHPVVMNGVEVFTRVTKQEPTENLNEYSITVNIAPVTK